MPDSNLSVAVTGPTGTFGFGLMPLLEADKRIVRVIGIARRPFDANEHGWTKMTYRQGDVRDRAALEGAFRGADVVAHLAFMRALSMPSGRRSRRASGDSSMPRRSPRTGSIAITRSG
jgi:uncharacterized protein YbjT (DUF2867 family)